MIKGIHHICLKCNDPGEFENVKAFYRDLLELPVKREWATGIMLDTGSGLLEIFNNEAAPKENGAICHFALAADNVDELIGKIRSAGCPVTMEPKDIVIGSVPPLPARIAFFTGPLGEEVELFDEK